MKTCVINQKGGTGKTTTSIHLAVALAKRGQRVLLIDNDPQGSIAVSLRARGVGFAKVLMGQKDLTEALQILGQNLCLLTSDKELLQVEALLHQQPALKKSLFQEKLGNLTDYHVIFDMAPSRSVLNEAALYYADEVLIPVSCDYLALVGVRDILEFVDEVSAKKSKALELRGILPTLYDTRSRISSEAKKLLNQHFPDKVFSPIRSSTKVKEAPSHGRTLFDYAPKSAASRDYLQFAEAFSQKQNSAD